MIHTGDVLEQLGLSSAGARILRYFVIRPSANPHARGVQRMLQLGGASLQRELERLVALGALRKEREGRQVHYRPIQEAPLWKAVRILESSSPNPEPLLREVFVDVEGVEAAFLFGSTVTGEDHEESDVDLMVVEGSGLDGKRMLRQLSEVGLVLGREVNTVRYSLQGLADRMGDRTHPAWGFVRGVITGPKRWIAGSPQAVAPLAAAAGLQMPELHGAEA